MSSSNAYGPVAIAFHWLIVLAIIAMFGLGLYMVSLSLSPSKLRYYSWHKWAGVTIFLLAVVRLIWRLAHPVASALAGMPAWQRLVEKWAHRLLYLVLLAVPLSDG